MTLRFRGNDKGIITGTFSGKRFKRIWMSYILKTVLHPIAIRSNEYLLQYSYLMITRFPYTHDQTSCHHLVSKE